MDKTIDLDKKYSTTRLLAKEKLILEQKPDYKLEPKLFLPPNAERREEGGFQIKGLFKNCIKISLSKITVVNISSF